MIDILGLEEMSELLWQLRFAENRTAAWQVKQRLDQKITKAYEAQGTQHGT